MFKLTVHAAEQCASRGITDPAEVLSACRKVENQIAAADAWEVLVIVKVFAAKQTLPDGSNGEVVLAAVDPDSGFVKTVFLQRKTQVIRKHRVHENFYIDSRR
jgi:hypothetical protein